MEFIVEKAPHIRKKSSVFRMMLDVIISLMPTLIFGLIVYGLDALKVILVSFGVMNISEVIFVILNNRQPYGRETGKFIDIINNRLKTYTINNFLSATVSSLIYALIMPANATWYQVAIGAIAGIVLGKLLFGGLGQNIFNPAAVGRIFAMLCFGSKWTYSSNSFIDVITGGTPLGMINGSNYLNMNGYSLSDMFLGFIPGTIGEISKICILVGLVYLLIRRSADFRPVVSSFVTFTILILIAGLKLNAPNIIEYYLYHLLSGGFIFGLAFMITDPVTSPTTRPGRIIYGCIIGVLVVLIRIFGAYPEGMAFSILIANMLVPLIDYYKWSTNEYNYKHLIVIGILILIPLIIILIAL